MDHELSAELTARMPIVSHEAVGADCRGCIVAAVDGGGVELQCNECGAVVGVIQFGMLTGLLGLEQPTATCPHCGRVNAFGGLHRLYVYTCEHCGKDVAPQGERVELVDTCRWYTFDGAPPIAVMRCHLCGGHPVVDDDAVRCEPCDLKSMVWAGNIVEAIENWNEMVAPGE